MRNSDPSFFESDEPPARVLLDEFLAARGRTRRSMHYLSEPDARLLLAADADYAALRLAMTASRDYWASQINRPS